MDSDGYYKKHIKENIGMLKYARAKVHREIASTDVKKEITIIF